MDASPRRIALAAAALCAVAVCGCARLFESGRDIFSFWPETTVANEKTLKPIRPARDALQIDIVFAERPADDPILGAALWADIDQIGPVPNDERAALSRLSLRVGNAGSTMCPALEKLLQSASDPIGAADARRLTVPKKTFCLGPSDEAPIVTNSLDQCTIDVPTLSGKKEKEYKNFKSILRMTAHRLQDGWARVEFVPEVHHGREQLRPVATTGGLQNAEGQEVDSLLANRFSIKLQVGEMAVITAEPQSPRSFGHHSFMIDDAGKGRLQRVLIVRLSNMSRLDPLYSSSQPAKERSSSRK